MYGMYDYASDEYNSTPHKNRQEKKVPKNSPSHKKALIVIIQTQQKLCDTNYSQMEQK
jgi:hypothetical protein